MKVRYNARRIRETGTLLDAMDTLLNAPEFQAYQLALLPELIALVLAQAGGADAVQVSCIARAPEVEDRVVANHKRAGDGQEFTCDALERLFKRLPWGVRDHCCTMNVYTTPPSPAC